MDSVRFGRALGFGARSAARALAGAVEAATAPTPGRPSQPTRPTSASSPRPAPAANAAGSLSSAARAAARTTAHAATQADATRKGFARGRKRFGEAVWGPFAKLSRVLWLEMTGFFFGIFAVFAGTAVWTHRADFRSTPSNHDGRIHLLVFFIMALAFSYFCISSFVRAYRR